MFSERLIKARNKADLTQEELCKKLDIARSTYANYETKNREPSFDILVKMSDILNVSIDWLLGRTNDPQITLKNHERLQYDEFMSFATLMFNDEEVATEDKEKLLASLNEVFWRSKVKNQEKRKK